MKVKVCGITDVETAKKTCEYGTDALGFVFAKKQAPGDTGAGSGNHCPAAKACSEKLVYL
ncbi:hypothetical protein GCM10020331_077510 [Ectobacillus funiculus]